MQIIDKFFWFHEHLIFYSVMFCLKAARETLPNEGVLQMLFPCD